jgi:hypothetical protein
LEIPFLRAFETAVALPVKIAKTTCEKLEGKMPETLREKTEIDLKTEDPKRMPTRISLDIYIY